MTDKRKIRTLSAICITLLILLCAMFYYCYDYLVLKLLIGGNYVFTDDLREIYDESIGAENFKGYTESFDEVMVAVMTDRIYATNNDRFTYLYNPDQYKASAASDKEDAKASYVKELSTDTVLISIPNMSRYTRKFFYDNSKALSGYKNMIIDLRGNYGGMLMDMYDIADLFLDKGAIIGYEITRMDLLSSKVVSKNSKTLDFDHIAILIGKNTASAAEGFTMALKENLDNVTLIGSKTYGKGIGQVTIPLKNGYAVRATVLRVETPLGNSIHKIGIQPDIEYADEDIIDFAREYCEVK